MSFHTVSEVKVTSQLKFAPEPLYKNRSSLILRCYNGQSQNERSNGGFDILSQITKVATYSEKLRRYEKDALKIERAKRYGPFLSFLLIFYKIFSLAPLGLHFSSLPGLLSEIDLS